MGYRHTLCLCSTSSLDWPRLFLIIEKIHLHSKFLHLYKKLNIIFSTLFYMQNVLTLLYNRRLIARHWKLRMKKNNIIICYFLLVSYKWVTFVYLCNVCAVLLTLLVQFPLYFYFNLFALLTRQNVELSCVEEESNPLLLLCQLANRAS